MNGAEQTAEFQCIMSKYVCIKNPVAKRREG